jgi:hypothetical protein
MSASNDPDQVRADIERTRAQLSEDVDMLSETANPKNIGSRQVSKFKDAARSFTGRVMGSDERPDGKGPEDLARDAQDAASRATATVEDAVSSAPARTKQKTRGNPLAAGVIAFGAGLLISSLIPASKQERDAVAQLQDAARPLKEHAREVAQQVGDNLREPAQQAAQNVKSAATDAAQNVKYDGESLAQDVQSQAKDSAQNVQDARGNGG